jgi:hypothetical protein
VSIAVSTLACSGAESSPHANPDFASAYASGFCDAFAPCCTSSGLTLDRDKCTSTVAAQVQKHADDAVEAGASIDQDGRARCFAAFASYGAMCFESAGSDPSALAHACAGAFQGHAATGGECTNTWNCAQPADGWAF